MSGISYLSRLSILTCIEFPLRDGPRNSESGLIVSLDFMLSVLFDELLRETACFMVLSGGSRPSGCKRGE